MTERLRAEHADGAERLVAGVREATLGLPEGALGLPEGALGLSEVVGAMNETHVPRLVYESSVRYQDVLGDNAGLL